MPSAKAQAAQNQKRQLSEVESEIRTLPQSPAKRRKLEKLRRHQTPSSFWDNLSRQWLTRRTLQEFDRRTSWPAAPVPPYQTGKENINLAKLKSFARHGGPSLGDIRGYPDPKTPVPSNSNMDSGSRKRAKIGRNSDTASSPRRTSAYSPALEQHLIDHGVYPHRYYNGSDDDDGSVYPENWEEINERLVQPRRSLSPSRFTREEFRKFEKTNMQALTEDQVMSKVFPIITGTAHILSQGNLYFGNLKHLTDGSITKSKPDFYDGACPAELNKQVRQKLSKSIEPSIKKTAPLLPNFFTEGKGPDGSASVCRLQAMYDGALGARGIHELRLYVDPETAYDNNAYTITSTYHGGTGTLAMYTTHPTLSKSPIKSTEYRMTQLKAFAVTSDPDTFRRGVSALRNARDWAKEQRRKLMAAANSKVPDAEGSDMASFAQSFVSRASEPTLAESETSADELALDPGMVGK